MALLYREQFYLQLKTDSLAGKLRTTPTQAASLTALIAQVELGDCNPGSLLSYNDCLIGGIQLPDTIAKSRSHNLLGTALR